MPNGMETGAPFGLYDIHQDKGYAGKESFFGGSTVLTEAAGYGIVLGFGIFFSIFTTFLVWLDTKYTGTQITSEQFNTAGRSVKTGLTASVIVSQWTWAATLLQSSNVAWRYGVSGPFWYASGATIQVLLFGILAIEIKRKARKAHTVLELVDARWGKAAHLTFMFFCFLANLIVTSMLLLGGAATVNALSGMPTELAGFLIPWGVIFYTCAGGLKATFLASYVHTCIIFIILVTFTFTVYVKSYSTDIIYDWLKLTASYSRKECQIKYSTDGSVDTTFWEKGTYACGGVPKNMGGGEYLTMCSGGGLMFGITNIVGNFGTVFVDQSYWQSGIAAKPASAHKGYMLGGLVWFTIPFTLATSMGLSSLALQLPITASEAGQGLVPAAVAVHLFGTSGGVMIATMLFMAIVSTGSAESIATSSLVAYDIYRKYFNKNATGADILRVSKAWIVVFGLLMGVLSILLIEMEISLGWLYMFMGILIGSAVYPLFGMMTNDKITAKAAVIAAWGGMIMALIAWMVTASIMSADIDCPGGGGICMKTLGTDEAFVVGNVFALGGSMALCFMLSCGATPFDWKMFDEKIMMVEDDKTGLDEKDYDEVFLNEALAWVKKWGWGLSIVLCIIWPILSIPAGTFTKEYFAFWVFIALVWGFVATTVIIVYPIIESWDSVELILRGLFGCGKPTTAPAKPAAATENKI